MGGGGVITTLKVSIGFDDNLEAALLRVRSLDSAIIFDAVEVDITGVGAALYDRLIEAGLRAPIKPYHRT